MKIALVIVGAIVLGAIVFSIWSRVAYRRWRKRFDALPPDEQRKEAGADVQSEGVEELRVGAFGVGVNSWSW